MSQVIVKGTLKPDGSLELDEKPGLPPGRVTVTVQREAELTSLKEDWWQYLQRIRAEREAAGYPFLNEAEVNAHIAWLREGDYIDDLLREADEQRRQAGQP